MLVAFSNQDAKQMKAVAGSMREAFGVQKNVRYSGIVESEGLPTRTKIKNAAHIEPEDSSITPTADEQGSSFKHDQVFSLAAARCSPKAQRSPTSAPATLFRRSPGHSRLFLTVYPSLGTRRVREPHQSRITGRGPFRPTARMLSATVTRRSPTE